MQVCTDDMGYAYIYLDPEKEPIEVDARCDFANQKPDS